MKFNTHVLSLKSEIERQKNIKTQLQNKELPFKFIDAVDLRSISPSNIKQLYSLSNSASPKRPLTNAEVGCSLSHMHIYEDIIQSPDEWHLILEDDADLDRLNPFLIHNILKSTPSSIDAILLGYSKLAKQDEKMFYLKEPIKKQIKVKQYSLGPSWNNWTSGTVAYLINKKGAQKILNDFKKHQNQIQTVADDWDYFHRKCKLKIWHTRPLMIFENFEEFESSIESDRKKISKKSNTYFLIEIARYIRGIIRKILLLTK